MRSFLLLVGLLLSAQGYATEYVVKHKYSGPAIFSQSVGIQVADVYDRGQLTKIKIDPRYEVEVLAELVSDPSIEYVVKNFQFYAIKNPPITEQALRKQWAIDKVNAQEAWGKARHRGSKNVVVAVIDTGVDYRHESLSPNMVPGYDFKDKDNDPMDETGGQNPGHGTHCAGIVGATGLIDGGVIGMSPTVSIMPLRFLGANGGGDLMDGVRAIDYAIEKKVDIISASWGASVSPQQAQPIIDAVKRADDAGIIFVVAAANDGKSNDRYNMYPANVNTPNLISVAASNSSDGKPSWSNYGKALVSLAAPGEGIMSTLPGRYGELSGTSMATPLVAGLAALLKAQDSSLTGAQVKAVLQATGAKVNIETNCNCRVDAAKAIDTLIAKDLVVVPNAMTVEPGNSQQFSALYASGSLTYKSSNPSVATIDANGLLKAVSEGSTQVSVTDASGRTATSLEIRIAKINSGGPGGPGGPGNPGDPGQCPIPDPQTCETLCGISPNLPWCNQ
ncbi:MAG: S8 family serine peptidase [Bdellovibrionales bacterium]|nr:S8 family serine peptidase [Bdellovibrionales bacterium]